MRASKLERIGEKHITKEGYEIEIISYNNANDCAIKFLDGCIIENKRYLEVIKGTIKNPHHKSVYNVGYFGQGIYKAKINNKFTKEYETWVSMLQRCYSTKYQLRQPTYVGVVVCEEWCNFQVFAKWFEENWENHMQGWHLDKDIICSDCRVYSPETCAFVPREINNLFTNFNRSDVKTAGIKLCYEKYYVRVPTLHGRKHLGVYSDFNDAEKEYYKYKKKHVKEVADIFKDKIDNRVYNSLIKYTENE